MPRLHHSRAVPVLDLQARAAFFDPDRRYKEGIKLVRKRKSFRKASLKVGVPASTLWYRYTHNNQTKPATTFGRSLTIEEEHRICHLLQHYARYGRPLTRRDLKDTVKMLVDQFPAWRKRRIRFKDGIPGDKFCRAFERRHSDRITYSSVQRQDSMRFRSTNAQCLTSHFARLEHIIKTNNIDPKRIVNVDETGISAWNESKASRKKAYSLRSQKLLVCDAAFKNVKRISILATVHGNGDKGRPMFVFQGAKLRIRSFRRMEVGDETSECIAELLPRNALVHTKKDVASIDWWNFFEWSQWFVNDVKDLCSNGRQVLLVYDGYRSHLSIPVLERFRMNGIIAYSLPSHTSGTTQPLDLSVFPPFKAMFRNLAQCVARGMEIDRTLDEFDVCKLITTAYEDCFTSTNIKAGFRAAGICPLDEYRLFAQARPYSYEEPTRIATVDEMIDMLDEKQKLSAIEILGKPELTQNGFLDTTLGAVVTADEVIRLLQKQEEKRRAEQKLKEKQEREARAKTEALRQKKRDMRKRFDQARAVYRANRYNEPICEVRTLAERTAHARMKFASGHEERVRRLGLVSGALET